MAKRTPLRIPLDFETTVKALLGTPPPSADVKGSRAAKPKARKGTKRKNSAKR